MHCPIARANISYKHTPMKPFQNCSTYLKDDLGERFNKLLDIRIFNAMLEIVLHLGTFFEAQMTQIVIHFSSISIKCDIPDLNTMKIMQN